MHIESERLRLRELVAEDAPFILALLNDPDFHRHIGDRGVRDLAAARDYIEQGPRLSYARHGFGLYLIERRSEGAAMGICGLVKRDHLPDMDIGYALLPAFRRQGYALEAAQAALRDGRERLGINRVVGIVSAGNRDSIALLERLGLHESGTVMMGEEACLLLVPGTD